MGKVMGKVMGYGKGYVMVVVVHKSERPVE